jgi:hypothetical protein
MMRSPERLPLLGSPHDRPFAHSTSLSRHTSPWRERSQPEGLGQVCEEWTLTCSAAFPSQIRGRQSLFPDLGFPVRNLPASARKARKIDLGVGSCGLGHLRFDGIPCYFPCYGQRRRRIVRGRLRPPITTIGSNPHR